MLGRMTAPGSSIPQVFCLDLAGELKTITGVIGRGKEQSTKEHET
jgi:hypothetical protein